MYFTKEEMMNKIEDAKNFLEPFIKKPIDIAIVAGSGLGKLADLVENSVEVSYDDVPHFAKSTVEGHAGKLVIGELAGKYVIVMAGRVHFYEGITMQMATFPIRVFQALNIKNLLVTNAAGGMNPEFEGGAIMLIEDHINYMWDIPLVGENLDAFGVRFPSMNDAYTKTSRDKMKAIAAANDITIYEGVYCGWKGPAYETPAEVRMIKNFGSDAVGMSTVPEVIIAAHGGMNVLAMSCITNMAAGLSNSTPTHEDVVKMADLLSDDMCLLTQEYIKAL